MTKTSEAQKRASRAWEARNPEKTKRDRYRRTARLFIRSHADFDDIKELEALIEERKALLKEQEQ